MVEQINYHDQINSMIQALYNQDHDVRVFVIENVLHNLMEVNSH
jgi:hypothetical protein